MTETTFTHLRNLQSELIGGTLPFVSWRLPGSSAPETIGAFTDSVQFADIQNINKPGDGFIMAPFATTAPASFIPRQWWRSGFHFDPLTLKFESRKYPLPEREIKSTGKKEYIHAVESAIQRIKNGELTKVVLSRIVSEALPDGFDISLLFEQLCSDYPRAFVYLIYLPGKGIWAGASPELLTKIEGEEVTTMALAGTRKAGINGNWSSKEVEEQGWVNRYITELFAQSGATRVQQSETYTSLAGPVEHLRNDFTAHLPGGNPEQFIASLHPTPAVCGWPKDRALRVISDLENHNREFYTGFMGPVNGDDGKYEVYVNLRSLQIANNQAYIYAGGGITVDSNAEAEWEETVLKSKTMLEVIKKC